MAARFNRHPFLIPATARRYRRSGVGGHFQISRSVRRGRLPTSPRAGIRSGFEVSPCASWHGQSDTILGWLLTPTITRRWNESDASAWLCPGWTRVTFKDAHSFVFGDADSRFFNGVGSPPRSRWETSGRSLHFLTEPGERRSPSQRRPIYRVAAPRRPRVAQHSLRRSARTGGRSQSCSMLAYRQVACQHPPWTEYDAELPECALIERRARRTYQQPHSRRYAARATAP